MSKLISDNLFTVNNVTIEERYSDLTIFSHGLGQDSTTILLKLIYDPIFRAKYAPKKLLILFADTGNEHPFSYTFRDQVIIPLCEKHGIEFISITNDMGFHGETWMTLTHQWENNHATVGSLAYPKTCTHNLKLQPQYRFVEQWLPKNYSNVTNKTNKDNYVQFAKYYGKIRWLVGIARGEEKRVANASNDTLVWRKKSIHVEYPLIDIGYNRQDCQEYINSTNTPLPMPSNCMFCPFGSQGMELLWMYATFPKRFDEWIALEQKKLEYNDNQYDFVVDFRLDPADKDKKKIKQVVVDWDDKVSVDVLKENYVRAFDEQIMITVRVRMYHFDKDVEEYVNGTSFKKSKIRNLGVAGKLHKGSDKAVVLMDVLKQAQAKFPNVTLAQLNEFKYSHGHCVSSQY